MTDQWSGSYFPAGDLALSTTVTTDDTVTVTSSGNNLGLADIGTISHSTGKRYFEVTVDVGGNDYWWGVALASHGNTAQIGNIGGTGWGSSSKNWHSNNTDAQATSMPGIVNGSVLGFMFDLDSGLAYVRNVTSAPTVWYGSTDTADPVAGTDGYAFTPWGAAVFLAWSSNGNGTGAHTVMNAGPTFGATEPSGSTAWYIPDGGGGGSVGEAAVTIING